jgi:hypothetical protein
MKPERRTVGFPFAPTWAAWMKMGEICATAPMVIGYRLAGMALAGSQPKARDRREASRMGQEKLDAWYEATLATGQRLFEANLALTGMFWRHVWGGAVAPVTLTSRMAGLGQGLLTDSLTPVHRRVVANQRRLSRSR